MINLLILGANGQLARNTTRVFLRDTEAKLTIYLRRASRLSNPDPDRVTIVEGDVLDLPTLEAAMNGQDAVYANPRLHDPATRLVHPRRGDRLSDHAEGRTLQRPRGVVEQPVRSDREAGTDARNGDSPQSGREPGLTPQRTRRRMTRSVAPRRHPPSRPWPATRDTPR
jgi:hypothetical protein